MTAQSLKSKGAWIALAASAIAFAAVLIATNRDRDRPEDPEPDVVDTDEKVESKPPIGQSRPGFKAIGGIYRPKTDMKAGFDTELTDIQDERDTVQDYGTTPFVLRESNPHTRSVAEALDSDQFPERLSPSIAPPPFDQAEWKKNPSTYLETIEPGRVFQPAQPNEGTPRIRSLSPRRVRVVQGEPTAIRVIAPPSAPVTFTSFDLGQFENQLTSITVQANKRGLAIARFTGTPGTISDVNILVASPLASGQLRYTVDVTLPKPAG